MNKLIHGIVRGNTIELSENLGLAEGQLVQIVVQPVDPLRSPGDGIRTSAGGLADQWTDQDDTILESIYHDRRRDADREIPA